MNAEIQAQLDAAVAPFKVVSDAIAAVPALVDAAEQVKYDAGYEAGKVAGIEIGKGMIQLPDPADPAAQYTQAQMDAAVTAGKEEQSGADSLLIADRDAKIKGLSSQIDQLGAQVEVLKGQVADVGVAVAAKQAEMLADFEGAELDNAAVIAKYKV